VVEAIHAAGVGLAGLGVRMIVLGYNVAYRTKEIPMSYRPDWANDKNIQKLAELQPELFQKFVEFEQAVYRPGKLSTKFKELMAVGITHATQCDACIAYHTGKAKEAGATDEEIAEAVFVAIELCAGAAVGHFPASARAMHQH
jgi:AhpD family alkylhydroperoxidase